MLLLDPGEILFEDYSVQMELENHQSQTGASQWIDGQLKMCSKSLLFVCKDLAQPLIKIQLKDVNIAEKVNAENSQIK